MVRVFNFDHGFFRPPPLPGLEEVIRFPGEGKERRPLPNSTVWIFNNEGHSYVSDILGNDVGCGMTAFLTEKMEVETAADTIFQYLKTKGVLGRGNHFVDICNGLDTDLKETSDNNIILVHTDGKSYDRPTPSTVAEALKRQKQAEEFRAELGQTLVQEIGVKGMMLRNWTHNSVEESEDTIIYRKGVIKVEPQKMEILPAHLGAKVLIYTIREHNLPPYTSMPHATGRRGPRGQTKVSVEQAGSIRKLVYIPSGISDKSLRTEHPSCFNGFSKILNCSSVGKYIVPLSDIEILAYVGKV